MTREELQPFISHDLKSLLKIFDAKKNNNQLNRRTLRERILEIQAENISEEDRYIKFKELYQEINT